MVDGLLSSPEAAGVEASLARDPQAAQLHQDLRELDHGLRAISQPLDHPQHELLLTRIAERLPTRPPVVSARLQLTDILLGISVLAMVVVCSAVAGTVMRGSTALLALACLGTIAGIMLMVFSAMIRRVGVRNLLGRALGFSAADARPRRPQGSAAPRASA